MLVMEQIVIIDQPTTIINISLTSQNQLVSSVSGVTLYNYKLNNQFVSSNFKSTEWSI